MYSIPHAVSERGKRNVIPALIAYRTLEELCRELWPWRLVYCGMTQEVRKIGPDCRFEAFVVTVQQRDNLGCIHYCRLPVLPACNASLPYDIALEHSQQFLCLVQKYLREIHLDVVPGLFNVPHDISLIDGSCGMIRWCSEERGFVRCDEEEILERRVTR